MAVEDVYTLTLNLDLNFNLKPQYTQRHDNMEIN